MALHQSPNVFSESLYVVCGHQLLLFIVLLQKLCNLFNIEYGNSDDINVVICFVIHLLCHN